MRAHVHSSTLLLLVLAAAGCGRHPPQMSAPPLAQDLFAADRVGGLDEASLRELLAAPVFLEPGARVGVVATDAGAPHLAPSAASGVLARRLADSGRFAVVTEVSPEWRTQHGTAGLREIAARYRCDYLLLYRERFDEKSRLNAWSITAATGVGALVAPARAVSVEGALEATLFEVLTGTVLFTSYERVAASRTGPVWKTEELLRGMRAGLVQDAAPRLALQVVERTAQLAVAAR